MKRIFLTLLIAFGSSLAITAKDAEKQCFDEGAASFAQKTKERVVLYGDKKNPKVSFLKYAVTNNPAQEGGYKDQSFYMIDLPKEILSAFSVKSWNDYLCGDFFPFAYPNVSKLTSIEAKGSIASVTYDDKYYLFRAMDYERGFNTPESIDSFSISIPGNMNYDNKFAISKIYPNNYVESFDNKLVSGNDVMTGLVDALIELSKIKDFEKRKDFIESLKLRGLNMIESVETFNNAMDEFGDLEDTNPQSDVYATVDGYLKRMDQKFSNARPYMTSNSAAFAEAVHLSYQEFDKEAKRYLKKIKKEKNKETEKNLAEFSKQTLEKTIGMIQRGIDRLGHSVDRADRQIGFLLNDYEAEFTKYLEKIDSGNHGVMSIVNPALSKILTLYSYVLDLSGNDWSYARNKIATDNGSVTVKLDDGTTAILYGSVKDEKDYRLLIRVESGYDDFDALRFNKESKEFLNSLSGFGYVRSSYLPPIQVIYSGSANSLNLFGGDANLLNETMFPAKRSFSSAEGIAYREKLKCVFEAVEGDMTKFKQLAGAESFKMGSGTFTKKNEQFEKLSCSDGKISYATEDKPVIAPDAKLVIKKIPNQKVKEGKYQEEAILLDDYVKSSNCELKDIKWSAERSEHLYAMIYVSRHTKVQAREGWCGEENIYFTAKTPKGSKVKFPIHYTVECAK